MEYISVFKQILSTLKDFANTSTSSEIFWYSSVFGAICVLIPTMLSRIFSNAILYIFYELEDEHIELEGDYIFDDEYDEY